MNKINLELIMQTYLAPSRAFHSLQLRKSKTWLLLILLLGLISFNHMNFFGSMSTEWIVDQQILYSGEVSSSEVNMLKKNLSKIAEYSGIISAASELAISLFLMLILASYYNLLGKMSNDYSYSDWFGFTVITQMPQFINALGFIFLQYSSSNKDLPFSLLNYGSINQILFGFSESHRLFSWSESFGFFTLWCIVLTTIGLTKWLGFNYIKSMLYASLPYAIFLASWFIII